MGVLSRRGILSLVTGAASAGALGVRPAQVVQAALAAPAMGTAVLGGSEACGGTWASCETIKASDRQEAIWRARGKLHDEIQEKVWRLQGQAHLPPHIASKRSWSPAFKESEAQREIAALHEAQRRLQDDSVVASLAHLVGVELPW